MPYTVQPASNLLVAAKFLISVWFILFNFQQHSNRVSKLALNSNIDIHNVVRCYAFYYKPTNRNFMIYFNF
jgi:hypothetical protein